MQHAVELAGAAQAGCRRCHKGDDLAPPIQAVLDAYERALSH